LYNYWFWILLVDCLLFIVYWFRWVVTICDVRVYHVIFHHFFLSFVICLYFNFFLFYQLSPLYFFISPTQLYKSVVPPTQKSRTILSPTHCYHCYQDYLDKRVNCFLKITIKLVSIKKKLWWHDFSCFGSGVEQDKWRPGDAYIILTKLFF
jgi:hypothetical protein